MSEIEHYLKFLDDAWGHVWESLSGSLKGLTDEEASFQPQCYVDEVQEEGFPLAGTILWHICHLENCKQYYAKLVEERPSIDVPFPKRSPADSVEGEVEQLKQAHMNLRKVVEGLTDKNLIEPVGQSPSLEAFLRGKIRHDSWHAAQIIQTRRMWKASQ